MRSNASMRFVPALVLALACGTSGGSGGGSESDEESIVSAPEVEPSGGGSAEVPQDPGAVPVVVIRPDPAGAPGRAVSFVVESRGEGAARLRPEVLVERRDGETWSAVEGSPLLRADCGTPAPECVELVPGAELRAAAWSGRSGAAQCADEGEPLAAGEYRFVVQSCAPDGHRPHRVASAGFALR